MVAQLLTESLLLALLGGAAGLLLATWGVQLLLSLSPTKMPRSQEIGIDWRVFAFAIGISVWSALSFGILPAWQGAKAEMKNMMRTSRGDTGAHGGGNSLVIGEVVVSFVLLTCAGLEFHAGADSGTGFDPKMANVSRPTLFAETKV